MHFGGVYGIVVSCFLKTAVFGTFVVRCCSQEGIEGMKIAEIFGSNVFSTAVMKERLPEQEFHEVMTVMRDGGRLSAATADVVAAAMKDWAIELGATHYTHWFQPLTGITA